MASDPIDEQAQAAIDKLNMDMAREVAEVADDGDSSPPERSPGNSRGHGHGRPLRPIPEMPDLKSLKQPLPIPNTIHGLQQAAAALISRADEMAAFPLTETVLDVDGNVVAIKPARWSVSDIAKNYKAAGELYEKISELSEHLPDDPHAMQRRQPDYTTMDTKSIEAKERPFAALQLRLKGWTLQEIADHLGYANKAGSYYAINAMLESTVKPATDELRQLEVERLDMMLKTAWSAAIGPHGNVKLEALDRCLAIEKLRIRLLGLEMPRKVDVHAVIDRVAEEHGYDAEEKRSATAFVEQYLRQKRSERSRL